MYISIERSTSARKSTKDYYMSQEESLSQCDSWHQAKRHHGHHQKYSRNPNTRYGAGLGTAIAGLQTLVQNRPPLPNGELPHWERHRSASARRDCELEALPIVKQYVCRRHEPPAAEFCPKLKHVAGDHGYIGLDSWARNDICMITYLSSHLLGFASPGLETHEWIGRVIGMSAAPVLAAPARQIAGQSPGTSRRRAGVHKRRAFFTWDPAAESLSAGTRIGIYQFGRTRSPVAAGQREIALSRIRLAESDIVCIIQRHSARTKSRLKGERDNVYFEPVPKNPIFRLRLCGARQVPGANCPGSVVPVPVTEIYDCTGKMQDPRGEDRRYRPMILPGTVTARACACVHRHMGNAILRVKTARQSPRSRTTPFGFTSTWCTRRSERRREGKEALGCLSEVQQAASGGIVGAGS
ncbi:hypothetical protein GGX14DRAFT_595292 [Mycena pura]|uniref:Uncharacterized protein n=1 Tax=Mycena pura TaxID=153505 RepID=A0AAD6VP36_9AGAR|nr:hypothetical protein GGX14DRAFT_595292 [Mycena pura]